jgi:NAD(P)-dependent dehydrogenase (short-subunit alcohol dehydrogenase family)
MKAKTVLITGSSTGIGRATVEMFSKKGWNVAATMRSPQKESSLTKLPNVKLYKLDVLDLVSIKNAIKNAVDDFGKIDVLVNNAGYGAIGPFEAATHDQIRHQFNTNVLGLIDVTQAIIPHFRKNQSGVIINISSVGGRLTFPLFSLYHGTKWAVEGFSESLHYELKPFGIKIKLIEPGAIKTDFYGRSQVILSKEDLRDYDHYTEKTLANMFKAGQRGSSANLVARTIYKAATDGKQKMRYLVGGGAPAILFLRKILPNSLFFKLLRTALER